MTMVWTALFLLVLLTTREATSISSHSCSSGTQSSASGNDADMIDLSQAATSLQYCMIDNCTIMRIDTGEELEISHTTESLLVAIPTDGHTSEIVLMLENEVQCFTAKNRGSFLVLIVNQAIISLPHSFINIYIVTVHLLFAELRNVFGKLLMSYNIVLFLIQVFSVISIITNIVVTVGSQVMCQAILNTFIMLTMAFESYTTCIMFHVTLVMYYSYKCRPGMPKNLLLFYNCFVFGLFAIFAAILIGSDLYLGNGKRTVLPDGHCVLYNIYLYQQVGIRDFQQFGNKMAQLSLFIIFLILYYKQRNTIAPSTDADNKNVSVKVSKQLIRIAIVMGTTIGIVCISWLVASITSSQVIFRFAGYGLVFQQCVVMASFMCTQEMSRLCRDHFYPS